MRRLIWLLPISLLLLGGFRTTGYRSDIEIYGDYTFQDSTTMDKLVVQDNAVFEDTVDVRNAKLERMTLLPKGKRPLVTFQFDDGSGTQYDKAYPVFDAQGEVAEIAIITSLISTGSYLTWTEVETLYAKDWAILNHSHANVVLTSITEDSIRAEIARFDSCLTAHGLSCNNLAYPGGSHNKLVRQLAREYFRSARGDASATWAGSNNFSPIGTYELNVCFIDDLSDSTTYLAWVDSCATDSSWLIFAAHVIDANDSLFLVRLIDSVQAASIPIVTTNQALDSIGNYVECGDNFAAGEEGIKANFINQRLWFIDKSLADTAYILMGGTDWQLVSDNRFQLKTAGNSWFLTSTHFYPYTPQALGYDTYPFQSLFLRHNSGIAWRRADSLVGDTVTHTLRWTGDAADLCLTGNDSIIKADSTQFRSVIDGTEILKWDNTGTQFGSGTALVKIVKVGSHLAIILTGSDTLWAAADTTNF